MAPARWMLPEGEKAMTVTSFTHGVYGGVTGGAVFGVLMGTMGMFPMLGQMVGSPTVWAGFVVHMLISAMIGVMFAGLVGWTGWKAGLGTGLAYGALWWVLGPLTLMPLFMGMGVGANWTMAAAVQAMPSLMGHLVFGGILGWTYAWLARGIAARHHRHADAV